MSTGARQVLPVGMVSVCLRCGCDDLHAPPGGCAWARVDRELGVGVCSCCADKVTAAHWSKRALIAKEARSGAKFFDLTPSWSQLLPVLLGIYLEPVTPGARLEAKGHLQHMSKVADVCSAGRGVVAAVLFLLQKIEIHTDCMSNDIHRDDAFDEAVESVYKAVADYQARLKADTEILHV